MNKDIDTLLFYLIHTDRLKVEEKQKIADYITNLQQINNNQAQRNSRQRLANKKQQDLILNLQQIEQDHKETNARLMSELAKLEEENKIKDTNWESLKYYLEKLYYKDYIEEAISDDIDKKIQELESKVEIKGYQKDIKALQQEKDNLYLDYTMLKMEKDIYKQGYEELKELIEKAITEVKND